MSAGPCAWPWDGFEKETPISETAQAMELTRDDAGRFRPGTSGNPGGRPKGYEEARALAQEHSEEALLRLVELMRGDDPRVAKAACDAILDRAWGKPSQAIQPAPSGEGLTWADIVKRAMAGDCRDE